MNCFCIWIGSQFYENDVERGKHMAVLLHGDGAFSGQGIVYETLDMSQLPEYTIGGTLHVVVNNQVAFTTDPKYSRSSPYCTDVAKGINIPVFHVNGDDVEAVARVMELAIEWRQQWKQDVVVDIVCYRKYGHNEIDEPMFTQPLMYKAIKKHPSAHQQYAEKLMGDGTLTPGDVKLVHDSVLKTLEESFEDSKDYVPKPRDWLASHWAGFKGPDQLSRIRETGVAMEKLKQIGIAATTIPETFAPHRVVKRVYDTRRKMIESGEGLDWAMAEALAFGTLLDEGNHVRLSGQDVERGTFSHRHALIHDQSTGERHVPLRNVYGEAKKKEFFTVSNSSLSEFGVLGFELGYSLENPNALVMWEAQFGDFANSAQIIIDQFISSGEAKWLRQTGLTLLLPHGYDGQGPEHSSCRVERYLQMSDEDPTKIPADMAFETRHQIQEHNWQICNVTTPANYFHLLRRQVHRDFRKPLIVVSPKNLLRHPKCVSPLSDFDDKEETQMEQGVRFKRLIMDKSATSRDKVNTPVENSAKRVVFCTGKVYYELDSEREALGREKDVKIVRIEQLCPFPWDLVGRELRRYPKAEVVWCQEEPMNMGAYSHVAPRFQTLFKDLKRPVDGLRYAGRAPAASTATGYGSVHSEEQVGLIKDALQ
jgi:2-oxoglutarate dehydrogenase E1 component